MTDKAVPADVLAEEASARLSSELLSALKRRPAQEARLAGVVRVLAPLSSRLRAQLLLALETMVRRASIERPLYAALVRSLSEASHPSVSPPLARALGLDDAGGLATLSAACFCRDPDLAEPLARAATSRHAHVAFAAELARVSRGESNGGAVASLAPKIKESHRISLCVELLAPLLAGPPLPASVAPALAVLRDAERHLGRWLVLAEVATRSGDKSPSEQARQRASQGPDSSRSAWALVLWALEPKSDCPDVRPTVELVARLSDRPSADKDTTFLFRLAAAKAESARPMLESLVKSGALGDECRVRAMLHLCRDYGEARYGAELAALAGAKRREPLRALAAAALYDVGDTPPALAAADELLQSRHISAIAWGALVRARHNTERAGAVVTESHFRRLELGWVQ
ncbi:MAG TPA: hypothetical protein VER33_25460 [Polyangiaceae bacterium]|nr:hypothetical protein [Polyangiaceae bacterium]